MKFNWTHISILGVAIAAAGFDGYRWVSTHGSVSLADMAPLAALVLTAFAGIMAKSPQSVAEAIADAEMELADQTPTNKNGTVQ